MKHWVRCILLTLSMVLMGCSPAPQAAQPEAAKEANHLPTRHLLDQPDAAMPHVAQLDFAVGRSFFRNPWVQAPASTDARDGLGPLFNAISCSSCHVASARGLSPVAGQPLMSHVVRLSVPESGADQHFIPAPHYGEQLQNQALPGVVPEGRAVIRFREKRYDLKGGEQVNLRVPTLTIEQPGYGELGAEVRMSARMAPVLSGLGLLEAVPEQQLLAWADPDDANGDGISGRPNLVWDIAHQQQRMGRFGWKAEQPSLAQQVAGALQADLGISSNLFPDQNCTALQTVCRELPDGGQPEISDRLLAQIALYVGNLAVPQPRTVDTNSYRTGRTLFDQAGCAQCHRPALQAGESQHPWLSRRTFYPYTDLLLHDMGEALADNRPVASATGREWRTPPLWGIGLAKKVAPQTGFLHDGRARNVLEAILWHGGEAQQSRAAVAQMTPQQRRQLVQFIESL